LCSDQEFINVSYKKIVIETEIIIFFKNQIEIDQKLKLRIVVTLITGIPGRLELLNQVSCLLLGFDVQRSLLVQLRLLH